MNEILKELAMPSLSRKQRLAVWYFLLSLCALCASSETTPLWAVTLVVLNFANAARLAKKVYLPSNEE